MRVRVYDEPSRTYFHSELYAALYSGIFERDLILRKSRLLLSDKWRREGNTYSSQIHPISILIQICILILFIKSLRSVDAAYVLFSKIIPRNALHLPVVMGFFSAE